MKLAELEDAERRQKEQRAGEAAAVQQKQTEDEVVEEKVEQASQGIARMSFQQRDEETSDAEKERIPAYA